MIPLVGCKKNWILKALIDERWHRRYEAGGVKIDYQVGTMIELPRAALMAPRDRRGSPSSFSSAPTT
jgi:pyruvate,orthophosphate dikinase